MAVQIDKPRRPKNVVLRTFARQAVQQMQTDFRVQHIWPYEIYPGFAEVNARRKRQHSWYATGKGLKSFQYEVMSSKDGMETVRIEFLDHLRFAEMGTAGGRKVEDVDRAKKSRFESRYVRIWDTVDGKSHRPGLMRVARRLGKRMESYLTDFYGREVETIIYRTFSGLGTIQMEV